MAEHGGGDAALDREVAEAEAHELDRGIRRARGRGVAKKLSALTVSPHGAPHPLHRNAP